jgi:triosephosphate isomerase
LSEEPDEENIAICQKYLKRMAPMKCILEMEIGITGGAEDGVDNSGVAKEKLYSTPEDVFAVYTGLSPISEMFTIAAAFGNVHGVYKAGNVVLRPELLGEFQAYAAKKTGTPNPLFFVFHGGSGSEKHHITTALSNGVVKMNVDTDTQWAYWSGLRNFYQAKSGYLQGQIGNPEGADKPNKSYYDPRKWIRESELTMVKRVQESCTDLNNHNFVAPKRKPIVGGNWKCNPECSSKLDGLVKNINACDASLCDVYVCPSTIHVTEVIPKISNAAKVCPQNCNFKGCGAYTGEMAVEQMRDLGLQWVMIGHSERREYFQEDDALLATKLKYILDAGMKCVFCIGEKLPEREKGLEATMAVCISQLEQVKGMLDPAKVVIAYEPVWAIGTGVTATAAQAQETHAAIRKWIAANVSAECAAGIRIQYGGSANAKNAPELSACPDIDGFLVGGASLKPEFVEIVDAIVAEKWGKK